MWGAVVLAFWSQRAVLDRNNETTQKVDEQQDNELCKTSSRSKWLQRNGPQTNFSLSAEGERNEVQR